MNVSSPILSLAMLSVPTTSCGDEFCKYFLLFVLTCLLLISVGAVCLDLEVQLMSFENLGLAKLDSLQPLD